MTRPLPGGWLGAGIIELVSWSLSAVPEIEEFTWVLAVAQRWICTAQERMHQKSAELLLQGLRIVHSMNSARRRVNWNANPHANPSRSYLGGHTCQTCA